MNDCSLSVNVMMRVRSISALSERVAGSLHLHFDPTYARSSSAAKPAASHIKFIDHKTLSFNPTKRPNQYNGFFIDGSSDGEGSY